MRIYWSAFLTLLLLFALGGCGQEQFGAAPQTKAEKAPEVSLYTQASCAERTQINPEVDFLYLVDNSSSNYYISSSIKAEIEKTISSVSNQFDYRIIGTPLLKTAGGDEDYQVLAKSPKKLASSFDNKKIKAPSDFNFFSNIVQGSNEPGLRRAIEFMTAHQSDGLFRKNAYTFVVIVSNGRDTEVEVPMSPTTQETIQLTTVYNERLQSFATLKAYFNSKQFRLFSIAPLSSCVSGYKPAKKSYAAMSKDLYLAHSPALTDQGTSDAYPDHYDLCSSVSSVFSSINSTIKQVTLPHKYKYWPMTATNDYLDPSSIKVFKSSPSSAPVEIKTGWKYVNNSSNATYNTRIEPTPGEPTSARHLVEFDPGSEIVYPSCVNITSSTYPEYFGYIVIPRQPDFQQPVIVKINGKVIPKSETDGWSWIGYKANFNIKVPHDGAPDTPEALKSGFMFKLNGSANYYQSGDSVEVNYLQADL
jgi:hypothetical protein